MVTTSDYLSLLVRALSMTPVAALDYARKLKQLADEVADSIVIVMRVYFEKPRTTTGWKGLINDPNLDGTFDIKTGLIQARELMIELAEMGLAIATEALDPISPQYLADLISWSNHCCPRQTPVPCRYPAM